MLRKTTYLLLLLGSFACIYMSSCNDDDSFTTNASSKLSFEMDTVRFDTVITTVGSSTKRFKVYNNNSEGLRITSVSLESGGSSGFRVNVDGHSGNMLTDLEILKKDSMFIFAEVTLPEVGSDVPTLVRDKLLFTLESGVTQQIVLEALGQDAIFIHAPRISSDTTWGGSNKPYIIYDSLIVDKDVTFTIEEGASLYFHSGAYMGVYGQLVCNGSLEHPITFRGDRTDKLFPYLPYDRTDSQWGGIILYPESNNNLFDNVDIHGGSYGIDCPLSVTPEYKFFIQNSVIHNVLGHGLRAYYCIGQVLNSEISNSGENCVSLIGGAYNFVHTTIAQFYPWKADYGVALYFSNIENDTAYPLEQANFYNCLITGSSLDEIVGNRIEKDDVAFNAMFDGCLINIKMSGDEPESIKNMFIGSLNETADSKNWSKDDNGEYDEDIIWGKRNFLKVGEGVYVYDFGLSEKSRARGIGKNAYTSYCPIDCRGVSRPTVNADAGCYQYVANE